MGHVERLRSNGSCVLVFFWVGRHSLLRQNFSLFHSFQYRNHGYYHEVFVCFSGWWALNDALSSPCTRYFGQFYNVPMIWFPFGTIQKSSAQDNVDIFWLKAPSVTWFCFAAFLVDTPDGYDALSRPRYAPSIDCICRQRQFGLEAHTSQQTQTLIVSLS